MKKNYKSFSFKRSSVAKTEWKKTLHVDYEFVAEDSPSDASDSDESEEDESSEVEPSSDEDDEDSDSSSDELESESVSLVSLWNIQLITVKLF